MPTAPTLAHNGDVRVPRYHRRGRIPPGKLRTITEQLVGTWQANILEYGIRYISEIKPTLMSARDEHTETEFQTEMQKLRRHVRDMFTDMLPEPRIIENVTGKGRDKLLDTPLWPAGPA